MTTLALGLLVAPAAGYREAAVPAAGALAGVVKLAGVRPSAPRRDEPVSAEACGEAAVPDVVRGAEGTVVLLDGVAAGRKPSDADVVLDVHDCQLQPHVTAIMAGERVRIRNSDSVLHNPQGFEGGAPVFNVALPRHGQVVDITKRLQAPGVVHVVCGVHGHMSGWIVVHDSPYVTVADEHGAFRIADVPPGRYRLRVWHEGFRRPHEDASGHVRFEPPHTTSRQVSIAPGATTTIEVTLP